MGEIVARNLYEIEEQSGIFSGNLQQEFFDYIQAKPATKNTYMKGIKQFYLFLDVTGNKQPDMKTIIEFVDYLQHEQKDDFGEVIRKASKPATVNLYLTAVKLFFQWLEDNGIYSNVARRVKRIKVDNNYHKRDYLTADQSRDVLEGIDRSNEKGLRDYAIISLMLTTGLRDIEVMNANVEDFRAVRGYMALFVKGKGYNEGNVEFVKVGRKTEKAIREYLNARKAKDGEALFTSVSNRDAGHRMTTRHEQKDDFGEVIRKASKPATVNLYLTAVKLFFQWLEDNGIYSNVARRVKRIKVDNNYHKRDYLTADQSRDVLEGIDRSNEKGLRDYAIISLMLTTGLRDIEVMNANVEDFRAVRGYMALFVKGKGYNEGNVEFVKVGRKTEKAIREYLNARKAKDGEALFTSVSNRDAGHRMTTRSISRIAKGCMIAAGYESDRLTAHSMRHTAATLNMSNGGTLHETQQLLRHSNINTTLIYSHDITRDNNNSSYRVEAAIMGA